MKVQTYDGAVNKRILIGMITDARVLARVAMRWSSEYSGMFNNTASNDIGLMCVRYFRKHKKAPRKNIETVFMAWAEDKRKYKDRVQQAEKLLSSLSGDYERDVEINSEHVIDIAGKHFDEVRARHFLQVIEGDLNSGDTEKAVARFNEFRRVQMGVGSYEKLILDENSFDECFEDEDADTLIHFPGDAGDFYGSLLARECFIAFLAPEKGKKSFMLMDMAYRALEQNRKVAFFEVGDMTRKQWKKRFVARLTSRPYRNWNTTWPIEVDYPVRISYTKGEKKAHVHRKLKTFQENEVVSLVKVRKASRLFQEDRESPQDDYFRFSVHSNSSINVEGVRQILDEWEDQDGWVADVVIIDYADILADPNGVNGDRDPRRPIDVTWKQLRALSQDKHNLVVTATQANRSGYTVPYLTKEHMGNDKRKTAHVTGIVGLNVNREEHEEEIVRLNWVAGRDTPFPDYKCLHTACCFTLVHPIVCSTW